MRVIGGRRGSWSARERALRRHRRWLAASAGSGARQGGGGWRQKRALFRSVRTKFGVEVTRIDNFAGWNGRHLIFFTALILFGDLNANEQNLVWYNILN